MQQKRRNFHYAVSLYSYSLNGPEMGEADETLKEALNLHFAKKHGHWNFTTNSVFKTSGLTVKKILEKRNKMNIY